MKILDKHRKKKAAKEAARERCAECGSTQVFSRSNQGSHCFVHPPK